MSGAPSPAGRPGRGVRWRLFLTCWVIFALHFATNVVREHYPALALAYRGDFVLDDYAGLHPDIFEHEDGHHYINNQVVASVLAAPVVVLGRPALDVLLEKGRAAAKRAGARDPPAYDTEYAMRARFFQDVKRRGIDLQLGGLTALTSALFMAPLSAWLVLLLFDALLVRGVPLGRSTWLALVFGLGTPVFYRAAILNHNQLMALAAFASFLVLFRSTDRPSGSGPGVRTYALSGFCAGFTLALDYAGVVALLALFAYALLRAHRDGGLGAAVRLGTAFVVGTFPPVFLLWGTQWAQFGNPFLPAQFWMADPNEHVHTGFRGMGLPDLDLVLENLFDWDWGLFPWAPVLLLALVPSFLGRRGGTSVAEVVPRLERRWVLGFGLAFLLFSSGNQFARLQWNTGFRYFIVLVPFLFLLAAGPLARMPRRVVIPVGVLAILHGWALAMVRYTPPTRGDQNAIAGTYERLLDGGVQFPWHGVLTRTGSFDVPLLGSAAFPYVLLALLAVGLVLLWRGAPRSAPTVS